MGIIYFFTGCIIFALTYLISLMLQIKKTYNNGICKNCKNELIKDSHSDKHIDVFKCPKCDHIYFIQKKLEFFPYDKFYNFLKRKQNDS